MYKYMEDRRMEYYENFKSPIEMQMDIEVPNVACFFLKYYVP